MKFFRKTITLAALIITPSLAIADQFCVRNISGSELTWRVGYSEMTQPASQEWMCAQNLEPQTKFNVRVAATRFKYSQPSCLGSVQAGEWFQVKDKSDSVGFECQHVSAKGLLPPVKMGVAQSSWLLQGRVMISAPISGAKVRVYNAANVVVADNKMTDSNGYFSFPVKSANLDGYRIQATGGSLGPQPFSGTLTLVVEENFDIEGKFLYLNPVTTLIAEGVREGARLNEAESRVRGFLDFGINTAMTANGETASFSSRAFLKEANEEGGFNKFVKNCVADMNASPENRQIFLPAKNLKFASMIAIELGKGVLGKIGSEIFGKFLGAIGYSDDAAKALVALAEISKKLDQIQKDLEDLKIDVLAGTYQASIREINKDYGTIHGISEEIATYAEKVRLNSWANRTYIDQELAKRYQAQFVRLRTKAIDLAPPFADSIYTAFVPKENIGLKSISRMYIEMAIAQQKKIIRPEFFKAVKAQYDTLTLMQVEAMTLYKDAMAATEAGEPDRVGLLVANAKVELSLKNMEKQKIDLPPILPFTNSDAVAAISKGEAFYMIDGNWLWKIGYQKFNSCQDARSWLENGGTDGSRVASNEDLRLLMVIGNTVDWAWRDAVQTLGFTKEQANEAQMITSHCSFVSKSSQRTDVHWFGYEQTPWRMYSDEHYRFLEVQKSKGEKTVNFMTRRQLQ